MLQIKHYSDAILKNIHLELKEGQNLIVLGSNGAGKSTLAKVLCGITPSTHVTLQGQSLNKIDKKTRTKLINYIPAKLEIFDEYITLNEYLNLSKLHSLLESKNLLKLLELEKLKNDTLSNYELQRVKNAVFARTTNKLRDMEGLADRIGFWEVYGGWQNINVFPKGVNSVKKGAVMDVAKKYFTQKNRTVGVLMSKKEEKN